jgi:hypothetical protein
MLGRGRKRWSTRRIVEDCLALDIAKLVRSGVFRTQSGVLSYISWLNSAYQRMMSYLSILALKPSKSRKLHFISAPDHGFCVQGHGKELPAETGFELFT